MSSNMRDSGSFTPVSMASNNRVSFWDIPKMDSLDGASKESSSNETQTRISKVDDFNELLEKLRSVHLEVCEENAQLEEQALISKEKAVPFEEQAARRKDNPIPCDTEDDVEEVPKEGRLDSSEALRLSGAAKAMTPLVTPRDSNGPRNGSTLAPRSPIVREPSNVDLHDTMERMATQQEWMAQSISKMLASRENPAQSNPGQSNRLSSWAGGGRFSTATTGGVNRLISNRSARGVTSSSSQSRFAVNDGTRSDDGALSLSSTKPSFKSVTTSCWDFKRILDSTAFSLCSSLVILAYAIFIAIESDMTARDPSLSSNTFKALHYAFNSVFTLELLMRIAAEGLKAFSGRDAIWNRLDAFLVITAIVESVIEELAAGLMDGAGSVVRTVRITRVIRTLRLVRTFRQFHEFQKMAYALMSCLKTLACSLTLLIFVMFFFAVGLTQACADVDAREKHPDLNLRFGDLASTSYTLFVSVSDGMSWDMAFTPLWQTGYRSAIAFIVYIVIVAFGVLNVVTSIFVESVIRSAQMYKELLVRDKEVEKDTAIQHVKAVFRQVDEDGSGAVSQDEIEHFLSEPSLRRYMEALDIDVQDTRLLFHLLDRDGSGLIGLDEFCDGCLRLKGNAKSIDVHTLIYQIKHFLYKWAEFTGFVEESFERMRPKKSTLLSKPKSMVQTPRLSVNKEPASTDTTEEPKAMYDLISESQ